MPRLHTILVGRGRPHYVFLHGLFGRGKNWAGIARALLDANGDSSVLFDLPNHGNSLWTDHFDYVEMADLIAQELRTKLGSSPQVTLVGHSMGGKVAMLVALRHPDVVKGLVVIDIAPAESRQIVTSIPLASAMLNLDLNGIRHRSEASALMAEDVPSPTLRAFLLQNLRPTPTWHWDLNLDLLATNIDKAGAWPEVDGVYTGPVLWIAGGRSQYILTEHIPIMRRLFPKVDLVTLPEASHWVHADDPEGVIDQLLAFRERVG